MNKVAENDIQPGIWNYFERDSLSALNFSLSDYVYDSVLVDAPSMDDRYSVNNNTNNNIFFHKEQY